MCEIFKNKSVKVKGKLNNMDIWTRGIWRTKPAFGLRKQETRTSSRNNVCECIITLNSFSISKEKID